MKKMLAALAVLLPLVASAQYEPAPQPGYAPAPSYGPGGTLGRRSPWYIGFGFGGGSGNLRWGGVSGTLDEWNESRWPYAIDSSTFSANFKVGATLSDRLLVGFDITGVMAYASDSQATTSVGLFNYDAVATFFPMGEGLFVRGGVGLSRLSDSWDTPVGSGSDSWSGFNFLGGVGYALWLGQAFNLTLNLDYSYQNWGGSSTSADPENSNFVAFWVGFDWY
jgi:hypothetical protein